MLWFTEHFDQWREIQGKHAFFLYLQFLSSLWATPWHLYNRIQPPIDSSTWDTTDSFLNLLDESNLGADPKCVGYPEKYSAFELEHVA